MKTLQKTQRQFKDVESGYYFQLYKDNTDNFHLINDKYQGEEAPTIGTEVNGFFICAHCGITIKLNGKKQVKLNTGEFYNTKEGEEITHKKYIGFSKFTKI